MHSVDRILQWHLCRYLARHHGIGWARRAAPSERPPAVGSRIPWEDLAEEWARGVEESGDVHLPFSVALSIAPEHHASPLTLYASAAPSIGDVVDAFVAYWPTITDAFSWSWHPDREGGVLISDRPQATRGERALLAFIGAEAVATGRTATKGAWRPRDLHLPWEAEEAHARPLGVGPQVSASAVQIGLSASDLRTTPRYANPSLSRVLRGQLSRDADVVEPSPMERVRRELLLAFDGPVAASPPELATIAKRLGRSPRSLHRDLSAAGTTFRKLLEEVRADVARAWLPRATIPEVSERLGYAEPRAFHRAFRRWTGTSPAQWLTSRS